MLKKLNFERLNQIKLILRELKLNGFKLFILLISLYSFTLLSAFLDGIGLILLANIFTSGVDNNQEISKVNELFFKYLNISISNTPFKDKILFLILIFLLNFLLKFSLLSFYGWINASLRKKIQESLFAKYLYAPWYIMKDFLVGKASNINLIEAELTTKYLFRLFLCSSLFLNVLIFVILATLIDYKSFIILSLISIPLFILLKFILDYQSELSKNIAQLRSLFSSNIIDKLNGLFQINLEKDVHHHFFKGISAQNQWTKLEFFQGLCQAVFGTLIILVPLICFTFFYFWYDDNKVLDFKSLAAVILLGIKLVTQLNAFLSMFSDLSRMSGSLYPVCEVLQMEQNKIKKIIKEKINSVVISNVSFKFKNNNIFKKINLKIKKGVPFIIEGKSGTGKTTLVNLISGVFSPNTGSIFYKGKKKTYDIKSFYKTVGYVSQDIYLFDGTIRENLNIALDKSDKAIWKILELIDADNFIKKLGGLDAHVSENGKSLSGGQKRRIGIARALMSQTDILIFDEITNGLDKDNKTKIEKVIKKLIPNHLLIYITHEKIKFHTQKKITL